MYTLEIEKRVFKFIKGLPKKHAEQIKSKIRSLAEFPYPNDFKPLNNLTPHLRCTSGEYRIVYRVDKTIVYIVLVEKRNDDRIYSIMKRIYKNDLGI